LEPCSASRREELTVALYPIWKLRASEPPRVGRRGFRTLKQSLFREELLDRNSDPQPLRIVAFYSHAAHCCIVDRPLLVQANHRLFQAVTDAFKIVAAAV
jgi:hypothetical protein